MVSTIVPNRATAKLSTALMYGGSFTVLSVASTPGTAKLNTALPGCVAVTVYSNVPNRATRDNRIGRCVKSLLKRYVAVAGVIDLIEDRAHAVVQQLVIEIEPVYEHAQGNDAQRADEKLLFHFVYHPS